MTVYIGGTTPPENAKEGDEWWPDTESSLKEGTPLFGYLKSLLTGWTITEGDNE